MIRRLCSTLLLTLALLTSSVVSAVSAGAASGVDYVALGDSYSSGVGAGSYDLSSSCKRSSKAYPALWAAQRSVASFSFQACGGATSASVRSGQLGTLSAATDLVSVTSGGNDAGFVDVVVSCRTGSDSACFSALDNANRYIAQNLPGELNLLYSDIRTRAPGAHVVVLGYPRLYETTSCFGAITVERRKRINSTADTLNSALRDRAQAHGFVFADVSPAFEGHRICASSSWIHGPKWPVGDSYHPNGTGHASGYLPVMSGAAG
ncbi:SGNH/GDSL hydrolase family protein [Nocardiopsis lambiniae]|uniref:SGNH/GDSL hydrolase family protein n=1 Tax=Nocardiopsis lambiniae TaxID=3075539 RepID=A0ABU2MB35_9ACTN|nr:SGNH/GDSL hydrolase family protein [Nocardiopsis sp. DSM 44743]MDT0329827.1 SGNH/GDSL hydrolase family protein [Nocardiopsis sp. DSM 44743]